MDIKLGIRTVYLISHCESSKIKLCYDSYDEIVKKMARRGYYRSKEFLEVYYPDPTNGLVYMRNPFDRAIHRCPYISPNPKPPPKHTECEIFGKLENPENLEIRDTPIPEPHQGQYVGIDYYNCYKGMAIEIDLDKIK